MKTNDKNKIIPTMKMDKYKVQHENQQSDAQLNGNLPPISVRNNISKTIQHNKNNNHQVSQPKETHYKRRLINKSLQAQAVLERRTSIYNIEFMKKSKFEENINNYKTIPLKSTSIKLRMSGIWNSDRYISHFKQKSRLNPQNNNKISIQNQNERNAQKLKTIVMSPYFDDLSGKDLLFINNINDSSTKSPIKLELPKKQSEVLQKYLSKFKQYQSQQLHAERQNLKKFVEVGNKTNLLQQNSVDHEAFLNVENSRFNRINMSYRNQNPEGIPSKYNLQLESIKHSYKNGRKNLSVHQKIQDQCTPWRSDDQSNHNFDFS